MSRKIKRHGEAHVRIYRHELESPAYRSLSTDARALLVEFRALFGGRENRLFMSVREACRRMGITSKDRARGAIAELTDRGFIRIVEAGGFSLKVKHATVYALECQPDNPLAEGATAPKTFMRWKPAEEITVPDTGPNGTQGGYRDTAKTAPKHHDGTQGKYREPPFSPFLGTQGRYTDSLPKGVHAAGSISSALGVEIRRPSDPFWLLKSSWAINRVARPVRCLGVWP